MSGLPCLRCSGIFSTRGFFDCVDVEEGTGSAADKDVDVDVDAVGKFTVTEDEGVDSKGGGLLGIRGKSTRKERGIKSFSPSESES